MTTAVQTREKEKAGTPTSLRDYLWTPQVRDQLALALPKHLTADRVLRQCMTLVQQTPGLLDCTKLSIVRGIMVASELGLELSGPLGQAYLIPRKNTNAGTVEACFQIGYKGLVNLSFRSGCIRDITASVVYKNDVFKVHKGSEHRIEHEPALDNPGPPIAYYALAHLAGGGSDFEVMTKAQAEAHRQRYAARKGNNAPWWTNFDQMSMKTCIIIVSKRMPMSIEFQRALELEDPEDPERLENKPPIPRANGEVLPRGSISSGQLKLLNILWDSLDYSWERLHAELPGSELWGIKSRTQLSKEQVGYVIDHLQKLISEGEETAPAQIGHSNGAPVQAQANEPGPVKKINDPAKAPGPRVSTRVLDHIRAKIAELSMDENEVQDTLEENYHLSKLGDLTPDAGKDLLERLDEMARRAAGQREAEEEAVRQGGRVEEEVTPF